VLLKVIITTTITIINMGKNFNGKNLVFRTVRNYKNRNMEIWLRL